MKAIQQASKIEKICGPTMKAISARRLFNNLHYATIVHSYNKI